MPARRDRTFAVLGLAYLALWTLLAISPVDRGDWALENVLTVLFATVLVTTRRRFPFSRATYVLLFVFFTLHAVGAHYTYAKVPYDEALRSIAGVSASDVLGLERNHYDRLVHFAFGVLCAPAFREVHVRIAGARGLWGFVLPVLTVMAGSLGFEIVEWVAASLVSPELGQAYLGTQGDEWDAQKDMLAATAGGCLAMGFAAARHLAQGGDAARREWAASLRVKRRAPLES